MTVTAKDNLGNTTSVTHYYDVFATTSFGSNYNGQQFVNQGASFLLGDKLTSPASFCVSGKSIGFVLGEDPTASNAFATQKLTWPGLYPSSPWTATTDSSGQATVSETAGTASSPWPEGATTCWSILPAPRGAAARLPTRGR